MRKVIVQVVRAPAGGIRKHILDITSNLSDEFDFYFIMNKEDGDAKFEQILKDDPQLSSKIFHFPIVDKPQLKDLKYIWEVYKVSKKVKADIIHGHGAKGGLYSRLVACGLGIKSVYTPHGGSFHDMHGLVKGLFYKIIEALLSFMTTLFVAESQYTYQKIKRWTFALGNQLILNENALFVPENLLGKKVNNFENSLAIQISSFGLLRKIKGHEAVLPALKILKEDGIDFTYTIYGSGEEKENLIKKATELGLQDCFQIIEGETDIYSKMIDSHIVLHPSFFESFGYVPLEATINGAIVVSSLKGGLEEVMKEGETGFCFKNFNDQEIANCLKEAIRNEKLRDLKYMQAKKWLLDKYSMDRFINNQRSIYKMI